MYWLEFDTDVLSYNTPATTVNYQSNGKEKSYTPDFQVVRSQKKQIIEVKSQKTVESEKYNRLYQMLSGLYDETGWTFVSQLSKMYTIESKSMKISIEKLRINPNLRISLSIGG
jgi:TnsA endonuclease N terminal